MSGAAPYMKADKPPTKSDWASMLYLARLGDAKAMALGLLALAAAASCSMFGAYFLGIFLGELLAGRDPILPMVALLSFELLHVAGFFLSRTILAEGASRSVIAIREALFSHFDSLPLSYFERQPLGRTVTRLTHDVENIEEFFGSSMAKLGMAFLLMFCSAIAMMVTDWRLGLVTLASMAPATILMLATKGRVRELNRDISIRSSSANSMLAEFLNGLEVIRIFALEGWSVSRFRGRIREYLSACLAMNSLNAWLRPLVGLLSMLPLAALLVVGTGATWLGPIGIPALVAFFRYCDRFSRPMLELSYELHTIQQAFSSAERVAAFFETQNEDAELGPDGEVAAENLRGEIEFANVGMSYVEGRQVLHEVSFRIPAGSRFGLAGATGSGKTTVISLLSRLYEFQSGRIAIDGTDIRSFRRSSLRGKIGFVPQEASLFSGTVLENLTGGSEIGKEKAASICESTGLSALLERRGLSLDSRIAEGGQNLSYGERQVLCLARVLLRDPAILVLDEATANVDAEQELIMREAADIAMRGRTSIIIAHRLNSLEGCDNILVFRQGRLVERGTREELLQADGYFSELWALSGGEPEESTTALL